MLQLGAGIHVWLYFVPGENSEMATSPKCWLWIPQILFSIHGVWPISQRDWLNAADSGLLIMKRFASSDNFLEEGWSDYSCTEAITTRREEKRAVTFQSKPRIPKSVEPGKNPGKSGSGCHMLTSKSLDGNRGRINLFDDTLFMLW